MLAKHDQLIAPNWLITGLLLLILLLAAALRLWGLNEYPPSLTGDEIKNAIDIWGLLTQPRFQVFLPANTGREALFHYLVIPFFWLLGPTALALRLVPAFSGILLVALSYRWLRELLPRSPANRWVALLTALLVATAPWAIYNSRLGLRGSLLPLFMLAAYSFFWAGQQRQQRRWFILSGLWLGLAAYTYSASRLLPLTLLLITLLLGSWYGQPWRPLGRHLALVGGVALLIFGPLGWYFANHPELFWFRSSQVSLLAAYPQEAEAGQSLPAFLLVYWGEYLRLFLDLSTPWVQNRDWPLGLQLLPWLFWLGLARAAYLAYRQPGYAFVLLAFGTGLLPLVWAFPTTLRLGAALGPTQALLALGAFSLLVEGPTRVLKPGYGRLAPPLLTGLLLVISLASAAELFRYERWVVGFPDTPDHERWVHLAHLPTLRDEALALAAARVTRLVVEEGRMVIVPQVIYEQIYFPLQSAGIAPYPGPAHSTDDPVALIWTLELGVEPQPVVILSPDGQGGGQVTATGHWRPDQLATFHALVVGQQFAPETETVVNDWGEPAGYIIQADPVAVLAALALDPEPVLKLETADDF